MTCSVYFFFFNDTATTEIYTLSLHDALPICGWLGAGLLRFARNDGHCSDPATDLPPAPCAPTSSTRSSPKWRDRKSTRLNSSHANISYAVFCLKKKTNI